MWHIMSRIFPTLIFSLLKHCFSGSRGRLGGLEVMNLLSDTHVWIWLYFNFLLDIDAHRPSDIPGNGLSADEYDIQIHPIKEITA